MNPTVVTYGPFGGIRSSLNPAHVPKEYAVAQLNLTADGADLKWRLGFTEWSTAPGSFTACRAMHYVSGSDETTLAERILSIETRSGTTKPYSVDLTTAVRTEITDGGGALSLDAVPWHVLAYGHRAICFARGQGFVYAHEIGNVTSWDLLDADNPDTALLPPAVEFELIDAPETETNDNTFDFTGFTGGSHLSTFGGGAVVTSWLSTAGDEPHLNHQRPAFAGNFLTNWKMANPGGDVDASLATGFNFEMRRADGARWQGGGAGTQHGITESTILTIKIEDSGGSQVTCPHTITTFYEGGNYRFVFNCVIPEADRGGAVASAVRKITFVDFTGAQDSTVPGSTSDIEIIVTSPQFVVATPVALDPVEPSRIQFSHVPYDSIRDGEAVHVRFTDWYGIDFENKYTLDGTTEIIGQVPTLTAAVPTDADAVRYFVRFGDDLRWRVLATRPNADTSYRNELNETAMRALPLRTAPVVEPLGSPVWTFTHAGAVFYLYNRGRSNIRASWNGIPERLRKATDDLFDISRGVDWTMSDASDDAPVWGASSGASAIVGGSRGVYSSTGLLASEMGPWKKLANSRGMWSANAAVRWRADNGQPGIAYVSSDFGVWFAYAAEGIGGDAGGYVQEIVTDQRGLLASWLTLTPATDPETFSMVADDITDTLWLIRGARALVLRRSSQFDGQRQWEQYEYTGGSWSRACFVPTQGVRVMHSTGRIDQLERTTAGADIAGATRDNGFAPTVDGARQLPRIEGSRMRLYGANVFRSPSTLALEFLVESRSSRTAETKSETYPLAAQTRNVRFDTNQHGDEHDVTLIMPAGDGSISQIGLEIWPLQPRKTS